MHEGRPRRVLAIGAHPDDVEIGCGGTLAKLAARGDEVRALCASRGEAGSATKKPAALARLREREARAAAGVLGLAGIEFLGLPDGLTGFTREDKLRLIGILRRLRPELVFVHGRRDAFPDHRIVHELASAALLACGGPWYQEAGGAPWAVGTVLGYEVWHPAERFEMAIDVTATMPRKLAALREHRSQVEAAPYDAAVEGLAAYRGAMSGAGRYAEVFEVLRAPAIC